MISSYSAFFTILASVFLPPMFPVQLFLFVRPQSLPMNCLALIISCSLFRLLLLVSVLDGALEQQQCVQELL